MRDLSGADASRLRACTITDLRRAAKKASAASFIVEKISSSGDAASSTSRFRVPGPSRMPGLRVIPTAGPNERRCAVLMFGWQLIVHTGEQHPGTALFLGKSVETLHDPIRRSVQQNDVGIPSEYFQHKFPLLFVGSRAPGGLHAYDAIIGLRLHRYDS